MLGAYTKWKTTDDAYQVVENPARATLGFHSKRNPVERDRPAGGEAHHRVNRSNRRSRLARREQNF